MMKHSTMSTKKKHRGLYKVFIASLFGLFLTSTASAVSDSDGDGKADPVDNCIYVSNADQRDTNQDGYGNICDADLNNDGIVNSSDALQLLASTSQPYARGDADLNGDGLINSTDLQILRGLYNRAPGPSHVDQTITTFATVSGRVTDVAGRVIEGAQVAVYQTSVLLTVETQTDAEGRFDVRLGADAEYTLRLTRDGFADQSVPVGAPDDKGQIERNITMIQRGETITLQTDQGVTEEQGKDGALIKVNPADFVYDDGTSVAGEIQLNITPIDVSKKAYLDAFPGNFSGIEEVSGETTPIISFGTVEFEFSTQDGRAINLAPDTDAEILIPIYVNTYPDGSTIKIGDQIPLWFLDETTGIWLQEGHGKVVKADTPTGLAMEATVTHFTWWNCDISVEPAYLVVTVEGPNGDAVISATATDVASTASTTISVGNTTDPLPVPSGVQVCLIAEIYPDIGSLLLIIPPDDPSISLEFGCYTPQPRETTFITLTAELLDKPLDLVTSEQSQAPDQLEITSIINQPVEPVVLSPLTLESEVKYAITDGTLPDGLSLDVFGNQARIIGEPTVEGTFTFVVTGTDSDRFTDRITLTYHVTSPPNQIKLSFGHTDELTLEIGVKPGTTAIIDWNDGSKPETVSGDGDGNGDGIHHLSHGLSHNVIPPREGYITITYPDGLSSATSLGDNITNVLFGDHSRVGMYDFDVKVLKNLTSLQRLDFESNLKGDVADLPKQLESMHITLYNTVTGNIADLPRELETLEIGGYNTLTGDIANLPPQLKILEIDGDNTKELEGDIADLPKQLKILHIHGNNSLKGDIANLPQQLESLSIYGNNTIRGDLALIKTDYIANLHIGGLNTIDSFSAAPIWYPRVSLNLTLSGNGSSGFDTENIDRLFNFLGDELPSGEKEINIRRLNDAAPSAASKAAIQSLRGVGYRIYTN